MIYIPEEFDIINTAIGYTMKGWDFSSSEIRLALEQNKMLNPAFELATNFCPWDCFFCFTEDPSNPEGLKKRLKDELTLDEKFRLISAAATLGSRSINIVGAGEPTTDPHFWKIIEKIAYFGMTPIVYTEASLCLPDPEFVSRLYTLGVTVVVKVNSLTNEAYQNSVVNSGERKTKPLQINYFRERNSAIETLIRAGFNSTDPTRLAFDTIMCKENYDEIESIHRYARDNNIFVLLVDYLPSGRSSNLVQHAIPKSEQLRLLAHLAQIDKERYGIEHRFTYPYAGGVPCSIRGLGLYVKIKGQVYDCPGESEHLGNLKDTTLHELWAKSAHIRRTFDGGCKPKDDFWAKHPEVNGKRHLPIL